MYYKSLKNISDHEIADCITLAFSDYYFPIKLTEEELPVFFSTEGIDRELSFGAFSGGRMVGFILNSCSIYNGQKAVFDAGTAVIPEYRGQGVFTELFKFAKQRLEKCGAERYYLEVLQQNDRAIALYKKLGFSVVREFSVLTALASDEKAGNEKYDDVRCVGFGKFAFDQAEHCRCVSPSYEHSTEILKLNPDFYDVAYTGDGDISAFCIFSKGDGRICRMGYRSITDLECILQYLLSVFGKITAKNIDMNEVQILEMLYSVGFTQTAKQFEMAGTISCRQPE